MRVSATLQRRADQPTASRPRRTIAISGGIGTANPAQNAASMGKSPRAITAPSCIPLCVPTIGLFDRFSPEVFAALLGLFTALPGRAARRSEGRSGYRRRCRRQAHRARHAGGPPGPRPPTSAPAGAPERQRPDGHATPALDPPAARRPSGGRSRRYPRCRGSDPERAYKLLIFDCDGVLVDSERIAVRVSAAGLTERGWAISEAR